MERLDRILGCLLGGAVGDALGAPVEFMNLSEIQKEFGWGGIGGYFPAYGKRGAITDDTQMSLFTLEGLLKAWVRGYFRGVVSFRDCVSFAYIRWLGTQEGRSECSRLDWIYRGFLWEEKELHYRRGPGMTCLDALRNHLACLLRGDWSLSYADNNSKGCGGVMRVAPVGLFSYIKDPFERGCEVAKITHGHPSGYLASGFLAHLISVLYDGVPLRRAIETTKEMLVRYPDHEECLGAVNRALLFADTMELNSENVEKLGAGWTAEETLAIALFCSLRGRSFSEGVLSAVNHSGDSDSTGAVTGNILGTIYGRGGIPGEFTEELELCGLIEEMGEDLLVFNSSSGDRMDEYLLGKYSE